MSMPRPIAPSWQPRPEPFNCDTWVVDVWRISPDGHDLRSLRDQARSARTSVLAIYAGVAECDLKIDLQPGGKPFLSAPFDDIEFSLSHCTDLALLAVARSLPLGIDVEGEREVHDPMRLARRVLDARSLEQLASTPADQCNHRFLDLWTQMEARQKAFGRGIFAEPVAPSSVYSLSFRPSRRHLACLSLTRPVANDAVRFFEFDASALPSS